MGFSREISRLYAHSHSQPAAAAGAQLWHAAKRTEDLRIPPGNRLEALFGDTGSTASASMIDGGYASSGEKAPRGTLRSWTTTRDEAL
jgi:hypothetical protein